MPILALDVGTSSVKATVLDVAAAQPVGEIVRVVYDLDQPTPETATLSPDRLWNAIADAARQAVAGKEVAGVGISSLSPALILLDARQQPLTPIITHLDRRARPTAQEVWDDVGPQFLATTGNLPLPGGITAVVFKHLAQQNPDLTLRVRHYLHFNSWLGLRLTGRAAFDPANACFSGLYDSMTTRLWSPRWCAYFGVAPAWLPPIQSGDVTLGPLLPEPARLLGVAPGVPVKLGTADTSCAMLAAGMQAGDLLHVVGTTQVLAVLAKRPRPAANRLTRPLGVGADFVYVSHNPVGGVALDWMHELCFREQSKQEFYARTMTAAVSRSTTVVLDPPFLGGDRLQIAPRRAAFRELALATDRLDLLAAMLNAMRTHHYEAVAALEQPDPFRRVFLSGGGAEVVRQLIPEYQHQEVIQLEEASLRGVARLFA